MELSLSLGEVPPFSGDADRIGQAIDNLLTNAIKFTPAGGTVELRIGTAGEQRPGRGRRTPATASRPRTSSACSTASTAPPARPRTTSRAPASA